MTVPAITVTEAQALLASGEPPRLIDVREEDEWEFCRLPGAELIPLSQFAELAGARLVNKEEPLLIYCHHGGRSGQATAYLLQQGYGDVTNLSGGIDAWSREIDPAIPRY